MRRLKLSIMIVLVACIAAAVGSLATWYSVDRIGLIQAACKAGLPNISKPEYSLPNYLDCAAFSEKRRYFGIARRAGRSVHLEGFGPKSDTVARMVCDDAPCWQVLQDLPSERVVKADAVGIKECDGFDVGLTGVVLNGWLTQTTYIDADGQQLPVFVLSEILETFPPAGSRVAEQQRSADAMAEVCAAALAEDQ